MPDTIERETLIRAPVEEVWSILTDPDGLAGWLADEIDLDLRPGGEARFTCGQEVRTGWVEEVVPPRSDGTGLARFAFWWAATDEPATRVSFEVAPSESGGSVLRIRETRPLDLLDLVGIPLSGHEGRHFGPALVAG